MSPPIARRVRSPEFLAFDDGYRTWTWTYAELARQAQAFALALRSRGIVSGQAIAIWSENRPEWIAALWGALLEGVVLVPIDYRASSDFLRKVAAIVDAKAILSGDAVDTSALGTERPVWRLHELARSEAARAGGRPDLDASDLDPRASAPTPPPKSSSPRERQRSRRASC